MIRVISEEGVNEEGYDWKQDKLMLLYSALGLLQITVSVLYFNSMGIRASLYLGWLILGIGMMVASMGWQELKKEGQALEGKSPVHSTKLVDTGIYSVVRHPQYFGFLTVAPALILLSQHWLSAVLGVSWGILFHMDERTADEMLLNKFGDDYGHYMEDVPGINLPAGIFRRLAGNRAREARQKKG